MSAGVKIHWRKSAIGVRSAWLEVCGATRSAQAKLVLEVESWPRRTFEGDSEAAQIACARQMLLDALDALAGDGAEALVEAGAEGGLAGVLCSLLPGHVYYKGRGGLCGDRPRDEALIAEAGREWRRGHRGAMSVLWARAHGRCVTGGQCGTGWLASRLCAGSVLKIQCRA